MCANRLECEQLTEVAFDGTFEMSGVEADIGERVGAGFDGVDGVGGAADGGQGVRRRAGGRRLGHLFIDEVGFKLHGAEEFPLRGGHVKDAEVFGEAEGRVSAMEFGEEGIEGGAGLAFDEGGSGGESVTDAGDDNHHPLEAQSENRLRAAARARGVSTEDLVLEAVENVLKECPVLPSGDESRSFPPCRRTRSLRGLLAKYGPAPSEEEIDAKRRETLRNFPWDDKD